MHFKKLEIVGFKSFAEKTTLLFERGITAIVGPNGAGKSNVFDAIRWVLGEQSIRSLRGTKMEDVIFNGAENRSPLNLAEVSLTFSNQAKIFPVDYDEITITRRVFRSGDGEYLLNKSRVRLRDISELLMGTGIGAESYSLIEQGKVDLVLSSRPEDRRLIFDEAAGVTKYKSKKKEAIRKLEDTESNLLRVNDIIAEVKRQIASLQRQANKARRYKEQFQRLKRLDMVFAGMEISELLREGEDIRQGIVGLGKKEEQGRRDLKAANERLQGLRLQMRSLETEINQDKDEEYALINILDKNSEFININNERIKEAETEIIRLRDEGERAKKRQGLDREKAEEMDKELAEMSGRRGEKEKELDQKEEILSLSAREIKNAQDGIEVAKKQILSFAQDEAGLNNELSGFNLRISNLLARDRRLNIEREKITQERTVFDSQIGKVKDELGILKSALEKLSQEEDDKRLKLQRDKREVEGLQRAAQSRENQRLSLKSQLEFLEKLKLQYEDISEVLSGVFLLDRLPAGQLSGILSKVRGIERSGNGYKVICEAKPIPLDVSQIREKMKRVVREIAEIEEKLSALKETIGVTEQEMAGLGDILHQREIEFNNRRTTLEGLEGQRRKLSQELEVIDIECCEGAEELRALRGKQAQSQTAIEECRRKSRENQERIDGLDKDIERNIRIREESNVSIARLKAELSSFSERENTISRSLQLMRDRLREGEVLLADMAKNINGLGLRKERLNLQNEDLQQEIIRVREKKEAVSKKITQAKEALKQRGLDCERAEQDASLLQREIEGIKAEINKSNMRQQEIAFKRSTVKQRIGQSYKIDIDDFPHNPAQTGGDFPDKQLYEDKEALVAEIERVRSRVSSFGAVNLVAIEEYEELNERFEFLSKQEKDLLLAKQSLKEAIAKINKVTRQMFLETFEKVNAEFRVYFRLLFGGGDARLVLVDEQNALESGIEIIARPPGKKLQNISLMSGGEKSLSAIALIFAIFKVKPSPFCVLDEIDAALDESNVDRFNRLLQDFTHSSQFLVISHNKKTITAANVMYGVTMEDEGISKVVSARLKKEGE